MPKNVPRTVQRVSKLKPSATHSAQPPKTKAKVGLKPGGKVKAKLESSAKPDFKKPLGAASRPAASSPGEIASLKIPAGVLLGAHCSATGGVAQAIVRAKTCGFTAAQLFVKNNKQWFAPPLAEAEAAEFRRARKESGIFIFAHNSYLVNLASQDANLFATSVKAMIGELERAEALGLPFMVMHPGSHGGAGEEAGLRRIVQGLDEIIGSTAGFDCRMALEITAGQGNALGYRLEHLTYLIENVTNETRCGVCLDTAHLFAAGYNISTRDGYEETVAALEKLGGIGQVLALHLNDSKVPLGKRVDRHDNLGEGYIGLDCFGWIVQDPRWARVPKVLETPKSEDMHEDIENLNKLASYLQ